MNSPFATVRVDPASGFVALKNDSVLRQLVVAVEIGPTKNISKNPVAEKAIAEVEDNYVDKPQMKEQLRNSVWLLLCHDLTRDYAEKACLPMSCGHKEINLPKSNFSKRTGKQSASTQTA